MNCIVTGGAGFIGSHIVDRLLEDGHNVIVIDDFSSGKEENFAHHKSLKNLTIVRRSVCDNLSDIFKSVRIDAVFHLAAMPSVPYSIKNPGETHNANVNGTLNLLNNCREYGVKRFVLSSSSAIYGNQERLPIYETMQPDPLSPYALHKLVAEQYCRLFNFLYEMECVCLRYFNVYGPRQNPAGDYASLIPKFIGLISNDKTPTIFGDGNQTRDFVFVKDVVEANMLAATTNNRDCFGEAINIGSGKSSSVNETTDILIKLADKKITPNHSNPVIEVRDSRADIEKAGRLLNWRPKVDFETGLKETIKFFSNK